MVCRGQPQCILNLWSSNFILIVSLGFSRGFITITNCLLKFTFRSFKKSQTFCCCQGIMCIHGCMNASTKRERLPKLRERKRIIIVLQENRQGEHAFTTGWTLLHLIQRWTNVTLTQDYTIYIYASYHTMKTYACIISGQTSSKSSNYNYINPLRSRCSLTYISIAGGLH